jgi:hypothetical protein
LSENEGFSDQDEENDPVVHSFGPFGDNILPRMASFTAGGSLKHSRLQHLKSQPSSPQRRSSSESTNDADLSPISNHVINQLAFSRLSSTPLSTIMNNLPAELKKHKSDDVENKGLTKSELKRILDATPCIGEVAREGKDAAGKALESEYYYIPDEDTDDQRRAAVVDGLRKPGLRNCRKQHKVSFLRNVSLMLSRLTYECKSNISGANPNRPAWAGIGRRTPSTTSINLVIVPGVTTTRQSITRAFSTLLFSTLFSFFFFFFFVYAYNLLCA